MPLVGVLFLGWDVGLILIAYWVENGVVGALAVSKILLAIRSEVPAATGLSVGAGYVVAVIFPIHYGLVCLVHGLFVFFLAGLATGHRFGGFGPFDLVANIARDRSLLLVAGVLLLSHVTSLLVNYVGRWSTCGRHREFRRSSPTRAWSSCT